MKNILFILFVLFSACAKSQTIPLDSFYTQGSSWTEFASYACGMGENQVIARSFTTERDSLINGMNYHLISSKEIGGYGTYPVSSGLETYFFNIDTSYGIIGGIRVAGKQVYFLRISPDSNAFPNLTGFPVDSEKIIYDYSIPINDTVSWQTSNRAYGLSNVVINIDSVYLPAGFYVKRFVFDTTSSGEPNYWLEGIGSARGFLGPRCAPEKNCYLSTQLQCYTTSSFTYAQQNTLPAQVSDNCFDLSFLNIPFNQNNLIDITIFPDPLTGSVLHFYGNDIANVRCLSVCDVAGKQVMSYVYPFSRGNAQLTMPQEKGIYMVKIIFVDGAVITKKIVRL